MSRTSKNRRLKRRRTLRKRGGSLLGRFTSYINPFKTKPKEEKPTRDLRIPANRAAERKRIDNLLYNRSSNS